MKKFIYLATFLVCAILFSQDYNGISYQGVARDAEGGILSNETISVKFRIVDNAQGEGELYQEFHSVNTDSYGLFTISIGTGYDGANADQSYPASGFEEIGWGEYEYCGLAVEIDFDGDGSYADMGIMKMEDVPTAKWAKNAENASNADGELLQIINTLQNQISSMQEEINLISNNPNNFSGLETFVTAYEVTATTQMDGIPASYFNDNTMYAIPYSMRVHICGTGFDNVVSAYWKSKGITGADLDGDGEINYNQAEAHWNEFCENGYFNWFSADGCDDNNHIVKLDYFDPGYNNYSGSTTKYAFLYQLFLVTEDGVTIPTLVVLPVFDTDN